jgi:hypothetical protein
MRKPSANRIKRTEREVTGVKNGTVKYTEVCVTYEGMPVTHPQGLKKGREETCGLGKNTKQV